MRHRVLRGFFVAAVLFLFLEEASVAQVGMQQSTGSESGTATGRSRPEAAAGTRGSGLTEVPADFAQLKLAPGFLLSLNVLDDSDFTGTFRVDQEGDVALPILGTLHVGGESVPEARAQIRGVLLEEKILKDPQVDLSVLEYSAPEVTIIGEVANPGKYPLLISRKLVDVLALAGGATVMAGNEIQITSGNLDAEPVLVHYSRATNPKAIEGVLVHPGDTVQVKRAGIVYVLGAVNRPGGFVMQEEGTLNLLQAISLANGTTLTASTGAIYLLRRNVDGTEVDIALPFNKIQHGQSADVQLRATDVLYVPTSKIKSILTFSQGILAAAATATIYAETVH
jgi:polysaccharide export outer membrane protein